LFAILKRDFHREHSSVQTPERYLGGEQDIEKRGERSHICESEEIPKQQRLVRIAICSPGCPSAAAKSEPRPWNAIEADYVRSQAEEYIYKSILKLPVRNLISPAVARGWLIRACAGDGSYRRAASILREFLPKTGGLNHR
jgi:hypothetical protein